MRFVSSLAGRLCHLEIHGSIPVQVSVNSVLDLKWMEYIVDVVHNQFNGDYKSKIFVISQNQSSSQS